MVVLLLGFCPITGALKETNITLKESPSRLTGRNINFPGKQLEVFFSSKYDMLMEKKEAFIILKRTFCLMGGECLGRVPGSQLWISKESFLFLLLGRWSGGSVNHSKRCIK